MKSPRTFPRLVMKEWPVKETASPEIVELYSKLRRLEETVTSRPEDWAFGQKPDYGKHANELKSAFNITDKMVSDFTRVCTDMKILDADKIAE